MKSISFQFNSSRIKKKFVVIVSTTKKSEKMYKYQS